VLGTTGGGKSTTIARLVQQAQAANMAVILLDVEGEYTHLHEPTTNN
jgi:type IV secretory pathway VirB4 component